MTQDPGQLVRDFLAGMGTGLAGDVKQFRDYLAEDIVWHSGTVLYEGLEASVRCLEKAVEEWDMSTWSADILHQAVDGNFVLNERVDHIFRQDGSLVGDTSVMAIFEVVDGKIVAWRDHYNPDELRAAVAAGRS
jgi:limonene-1,2-epoxide hydrolase